MTLAAWSPTRCRSANTHFARETEGLTKAWAQYDARVLRDYLVQDVQDPRINVQSILTRHFLIQRLFGLRFTALMEEELRFAVVMNWLLEFVKTSAGVEPRQGVLDALLDGGEAPQELKIPRHVSDAFDALPGEADGMPIPDYVTVVLIWSAANTSDAPVPDYALATFAAPWRAALESEQPDPISVLEPACGSANDYRFLDVFGIGRLLDYTGFDLCEKNVRNAKHMSPEGRFTVGNALEIHAADNAFDYSFVHDLFEHLSIEAMEVAVAEVCRVTRYGLCVGFFNMHAVDRHVEKAVGDYHWNDLSMRETRVVFEQHASAVEVVHVDTLLRSRFGCGDTHNKGAYTFVVTM